VSVASLVQLVLLGRTAPLAQLEVLVLVALQVQLALASLELLASRALQVLKAQRALAVFRVPADHKA
jgi:hypothetical protein